MNLESLMARAGCARWPKRWEAFFDAAMADFERDGCPCATPAYYEALETRYGILGDKLDAYRAIARAVGENEAVSRLLALLVRAMEDRDRVKADLDAFQPPRSAEPDLAVDAFTALAALSRVDETCALLRRRGLPEALILKTLAMPVDGLDAYARRHGGRTGFDLLWWYQLAIDGRILRIGRLEAELFFPFPGRGRVFQNARGETVALAHDLAVHRSGVALGAAGCTDAEGGFTAEISEADGGWTGHPFLADGRVSSETVRLPMAEWTPVLAHGDPVVNLHIPSGGGLDDAQVARTLADTRAFLARHFPDYRYRAFACSSWLMNPRLPELLGPESNIARFNRRFHKMTCPANGRDVFNFVFLRPDAREPDYPALPENTALERSLKALYLGGGVLHELHGWFL